MNLGGRPTNPGEMRTSVVIKSRAVAQSDGGFMTPTWSTVATVWARWSNVHGSEVWQAQAEGANAPATVLIRYRSGVDTTCALDKGGVLYEIVSVDNVQERNEYLELKVQRMKAG